MVRSTTILSMLNSKSWIVLSCWDIIADLKLRKTQNLFIYIHLSFFSNHRISNHTTNYFLNKWIDMFLQLWVSSRKRVPKMRPHEKWQFSSTIQTLHHVCKYRYWQQLLHWPGPIWCCSWLLPIYLHTKTCYIFCPDIRWDLNTWFHLWINHYFSIYSDTWFHNSTGNI